MRSTGSKPASSVYGGARLGDRQHRNHGSQSAGRAAPGGRGIPRAAACRKTNSTQLKQQRIAGIESNKSEPQVLASWSCSGASIPIPAATSATPARSTNRSKMSERSRSTMSASSTRNSTARPTPNWSSTASSNAGDAEVGGRTVRRMEKSRRLSRAYRGYQKTEAADRKIETPDKQNAMYLAGMQAKMSDTIPITPPC